MRERLIELLIDGHSNSEKLPHYYGEPMNVDYRKFADYLLANGVVVLPHKVYQTDGVRIYESEVTKVICQTENFDFDEDAVGSSIFLTKEEVETELKRRTTNG